MGGGAIVDPTTKASICSRLSKEPYELVKRVVLHHLRSAGFTAEVVAELPGKTSFGDLDVLYISPPGVPDVRLFTSQHFALQSPKHCVTNGTVMSLAVPTDFFRAQERLLDRGADELGKADDDSAVQQPAAAATRATEAVTMEFLDGIAFFQVDLIRVQSKQHLETARFYFSYSDVGSIIGRMTNYYALKFGEEGLWCELLEHTAYNGERKFDVRRNLGRVVLSRDAREICDFLGLSFDFWRLGIPQLTTVEDHRHIFDWMLSSPLMASGEAVKIFGRLNTDHRARAAKRPFYQRFLSHIGVHEVQHVSAEDAETGGVRLNLQPRAIAHFHKEAQVNELLDAARRTKLRQEKFCGTDILNLYAAATNRGRPMTRGNDGDLGEQGCSSFQAIDGYEAGGLIKAFMRSCIASSRSQHQAAPKSSASALSADERKEWDHFIDSHSRDEIMTAARRFVDDTACQ